MQQSRTDVLRKNYCMRKRQYMPELESCQPPRSARFRSCRLQQEARKWMDNISGSSLFHCLAQTRDSSCTQESCRTDHRNHCCCVRFHKRYRWKPSHISSRPLSLSPKFTKLPLSYGKINRNNYIEVDFKDFKMGSQHSSCTFPIYGDQTWHEGRPGSTWNMQEMTYNNVGNGKANRLFDASTSTIQNVLASSSPSRQMQINAFRTVLPNRRSIHKHRLDHIILNDRASRSRHAHTCPQTLRLHCRSTQLAQFVLHRWTSHTWKLL